MFGYQDNIITDLKNDKRHLGGNPSYDDIISFA
jgi:hypothetical protein